MIGQLLTGRYLILKQLGSGGFSETYLARDKYLPLHPLCVVKLLKLSADSQTSPETARHLFENEARILGQIGQHHPQIPALLAYSSEAEQTYLVQEYVEGENIGEWVLQGRRLTSAGAIELLAQVLPILHYIHSRQIIHRDIKPSNLMQRQRDGKMVLIDFGAACCLTENASCLRSIEETLAIGTPGYMPDEQEMGRAEFGTDLYALGIAVIQLLTGASPRQFQQDLISGELDWQTHLQSVSHIDLHLIDFLDRMVRHQCRDRFISAEAALITLNALPPKHKFTAHKQGSKQDWTALQHTRKPMLKSLLLKPLIALLVLGIAGGYLMKAMRIDRPAEVEITLLREVSLASKVEKMLISPDARILVTTGTDRALRLWSLPEGKLLQSLTGHQNTVTALYISHNSRLLASSEANVVHLWDTVSGRLLRTFKADAHPVTAIAISPDAQTLISGSQDGILQVWQLQTGRRIQTLKAANTAITAITCGIAPHQLMTASRDFQLQVWNLQTGERDRIFAGHQAAIMGLQAIDQQTLVSFGEDRTMIWNLETGTLAQVLPRESAQPITASANRQSLVTVDRAGMVRIWREDAGWFVWQASSQFEKGAEIALSPNQQYLVSWQPSQRLQLWRFNPGK
ncbi:serine/threonine-protein kinase [Leptolyngbya ohadii]|uniref:serine/threonine-protein kinase n=1 Tax=Leptolyngbya ohadii TaxID=1962290 RepID=UPI000B59ED5D|nr:serine/threonine-protein kinase [Leptolyngbya ohadii]